MAKKLKYNPRIIDLKLTPKDLKLGRVLGVFGTFPVYYSELEKEYVYTGTGTKYVVLYEFELEKEVFWKSGITFLLKSER